MNEWQPIETAPKGEGPFLLWGRLYGQAFDEQAHPQGPIRACGYWDVIDEAWALTDTTWEGPFIDATHWTPLPEPPA